MLQSNFSGRVVGLIITAAALLFCFALTAFAADGAASPLRAVVMPHLLDLVCAALGFAGTWLIGRLVRLVGVTDTAKRLQVEGHLREALHFAAENGLRFALVKAGLPTAAPTAELLADAMFYVQQKNPETVAKLGVNEAVLKDILLSKWPVVAGLAPLSGNASTP